MISGELTVFDKLALSIIATTQSKTVFPASRLNSLLCFTLMAKLWFLFFKTLRHKCAVKGWRDYGAVRKHGTILSILPIQIFDCQRARRRLYTSFILVYGDRMHTEYFCQVYGCSYLKAPLPRNVNLMWSTLQVDSRSLFVGLWCQYSYASLASAERVRG